MFAKILGLGTASPPFSLTQERALELAKIYAGEKSKPRVLDALYRHSGIQTRGSVLAAEAAEAGLPTYAQPRDELDCGPQTGERMEIFEQHAPLLAAEACRKALEAARVKSEAITHLVLASCSGFFAPGPDVALIKALNLKPSVARLNVGFMGCHGAFNALHAASALSRERSDARVLVCAVELCSLHMQYGAQVDDLMANALFADGAAAAVVGPDGANGPTQAVLSAFGSQLLPDSEDAMSWRIGANGFRMTLSARVPALIQEHLRGWIENWLAQQELKLDEIKGWIVHPGGPRILDAVERALDLPPDALHYSREILAQHGNMSSPTVLFILKKWSDQERLPNPCVMLGFGPGLVAEAALLR